METWKPVFGFENCYEISSLGNLRNIRNGKALNGQDVRSGYVVNILCDNNRRKTVRRHRLVAEAFIPNPENKREVNHKNGNKLDNTVENLEWATHRENTDHAWLTGLTKVPAPKERAVSQYYDGKWLATYRSIKVAAEISRIDDSGILQCCKGNRRSAGGYEWNYGGKDNV